MGDAADSLSVAISDAVDKWLAEQGGGMTTAYAMAINYFDSDGDQCWATAHEERQTPAHTLGLLRWHTLAVEADIKGYFEGEA